MQDRLIEMERRSVANGFREIEAFKNQSDDNPEIQRQFDEIVQNLQYIIDHEKISNA